ncbi:unnamed protein product [Hydatigera taeniaeformis]|uniref:ZP domain-containing protein n=1 Tax=Hydatigena taeniaeformis TaxID=6205 RepID=A0A0R3WU92_HYDTA|nr:unnamed protein product [Hydatigera taeniaeformis]
MYLRRRDAVVCDSSITFQNGKVLEISFRFLAHPQYDVLVQLLYNFDGCVGVENTDILVDNLSENNFYALSDRIHHSEYFIQHVEMNADDTYFVVFRPRIN